MKKKGSKKEASSCVLLVTSAGRYRSANDERAFFEWLERIEGFDSVKGVGRELHIQLRKDIQKRGLIDLIGLFHRYGRDLTAIPRLFARRGWLRDEKRYWFSAMFPTHDDASP